MNMRWCVKQPTHVNCRGHSKMMSLYKHAYAQKQKKRRVWSLYCSQYSARQHTALNTARVNTRHRQGHRDHISCGIARSRNIQYKTFIFDNGLVRALQQLQPQVCPPSSSPFHPHHASNPPSTSQRMMTGVYYVYYRVGVKAGATPLE